MNADDSQIIRPIASLSPTRRSRKVKIEVKLDNH